MSIMLPHARPFITAVEVHGWIPAEIAKQYKVMLLGKRGYYLNSMGKSGVNDRGIYDDAIILIAPDVYMACNANTDPSVWRKGVATLCPGVHLYRKGKHKIASPNGYAAFRPATKDEALPVTRDGSNERTLGYAINIHRGGINTTSSLGCQTIPPAQWPAFQSAAYMAMDRYQQKIIPYILLG